MKRKLICLSMATLMTLSNVPVFAGESQQQWLQGWTGKAGSTNYTYNVSSDKVVITNDKVNNGKFSDGEDSIIYYAQEMDCDDDFTLSATVTIDQYSTMEESSNPQQNSVGIGVIDELFNKTDDVAYTDSVFLGAYAEKKTSDVAIYPIYRGGSDKKTIGEPLSDSFSNTGSDLGTYDLTISKVGTAYTLTCGENSTVVEMNYMEDKVYPCLYIARNVSATFSNVKLQVADKKPVSLAVEGEYKSTYYYGDDLDLTGLKATVIYDDGSKEVTDQYSVKGFNNTKLGKQKLTLSKGKARAEINITVKNKTAKEVNVNYAPVKCDYYKNSILDLTGMEVQAVYDNSTAEILNENQYTLKINNKTYKNGDVLDPNLSGSETVSVYRVDEKGVDGGIAVGHFNININNKALTGLEVTPPEKTTYYIDDEIDTAGMKVYGVYEDEKRLLDKCEYTVAPLISQAAGERSVAVSSNALPEIKTEFKAVVKERTAEKIIISKYPRTTYSVGEEFNYDDMKVSLVYDNGDVEETKEFKVDASGFDTAVEGEGVIKISSADENIAPVSLKAVCKNVQDSKWRSVVFGQSSGYDKIEQGIVGVTAENYGTAQGSISVKSWDGSGKITNDHDGMSYYYTTLNKADNFSISADITVNKYLEHNNDDTKRNGQEAFGIMARDVIPLQDKEGNLTVSEENAAKDSEGVSVALNNNSVFASNIVMLGGYSGTGYDKKPDANRINLMVRSGVTAIDGGGSRECVPVSMDYPKEGQKFKLTLEKINGGFYASCYDYANDVTMREYYYDDSVLGVQSDDYYLGFFTARWADITVDNVKLYKTDKTYDQSISPVVDDIATADVQITSPVYTTSKKYTLTLAPENSVGTVTVKLNNKIIAENITLDKASQLTADLNEDSVNRFTVVYTPDDTLNLTSYEPIIVRYNVYHKNYNSNVNTVYASTEGKFANSGSESSPLDVDTAIGFLQSGQTLVLKEGTYYRTEPVVINHGNDGKAGAYKAVTAQGKVVFDFKGVSAGVVLSGDYWSFNNIEFTNCGDNQKCFHLGGSHCIVDNCKFYNNRDMGLQISRTDSDDNKANWPSYNLVSNCESYNNCDPSMINADGFGAKLTVGEGNVFKSCKSHHNVDDGWDLYTKVSTGAIGVVTLEDCQAYKMGVRLNPDGSEEPYGAGGNNGFKLGGENVAVKHKIINCTAYDNLNNGFTTNSNPNLHIVNCNSHDNQGSNFRLYSDKPEEYNYTVEGVTSENSGKGDIIGTLNIDTQYKNHSDVPLNKEDNHFELAESE